jgi:hypothetical protein
MNMDTRENEVSVFGLRVLAPDYFRGRSRILAHFDCDVRGLRLHGCALLLKGPLLLVAGPRLGTGTERSVRFIDGELAERVKRCALRVFHQFGGTLPDDQLEGLPDGIQAMLGSSAAGAWDHA